MSLLNDFPHEHTAPVAIRMPHLPITATTKIAEGPDSPSSPVGSCSSPISGQSAASTKQTQPIEESPVQPGDCYVSIDLSVVVIVVVVNIMT